MSGTLVRFFYLLKRFFYFCLEFLIVQWLLFHSHLILWLLRAEEWKWNTKTVNKLYDIILSMRVSAAQTEYWN